MTIDPSTACIGLGCGSDWVRGARGGGLIYEMKLSGYHVQNAKHNDNVTQETN